MDPAHPPNETQASATKTAAVGDALSGLVLLSQAADHTMQIGREEVHDILHALKDYATPDALALVEPQAKPEPEPEPSDAPTTTTTTSLNDSKKQPLSEREKRTLERLQELIRRRLMA